MKKIIVSVLSIFAFSPVFAQEKEKPASDSSAIHANPEAFEFFNKDGSYSANVAVYGFAPVYKHWAISMYFLIENDRDTVVSGAEGLIGPSYVSKCFEAGILLGIETPQKGLRYSPWFVVRSKNERFVSLFVYEKGPSGEGLRAEAWYSFKLNENWQIKAGAIAHRPHYGPAVKIQRKKLYLYADPYMWSWDAKEPAVSLIGLGAEF